MTEQELVKNCLADICKKIGFNSPSALMQRDYELMSQEIEDTTGILISVSTIKRLLNGEFSRMPQTATLNAISAYLGFKNWQEYKISLLIKSNGTTATGSNGTVHERNKTLFNLNPKWMIWASIIGIGIIAILGFINFSSKSGPHYNKAQFSAKKTTDNSIPNTVVFNYNIDEVNADSFFIQQSWDKNRRVRINKGSYTLTDIYYEPGYHLAKLIANDSIIKTVDVSIPTDGWFLLARDRTLKSIPQYINNSRAFKNGYLGLDKADLDSSQISTDNEKIFFYSWFPKNIEVSSDNYRLTARVRMKEVKNNFCPYIMYEVFCQRYFMYFISQTKGCASESKAQYGETCLDGKTTDLSALSSDVTQWTDVEVLVKNKQVTVSINNKPVLTTAYTHHTGLLTGLGFISNGLCEVDAVELKGLDGKIVCKDDFNSKPATAN